MASSDWGEMSYFQKKKSSKAKEEILMEEGK